MDESEKYRLMIIRSPDIVYVLDPDGRFIFAGGALEPLTGYTPEELLGKHFTSFIWPDDIEEAGRHFHERRTGSRATRAHQVRLLTKKGKKRDFDLRYRTMELDAFGMWDNSPTAKDKKFCGTYGVARDITSRVRVEESLKSLYEETSLQLDERKAMSGMLIHLLETEKERIAEELHDHIGQALVSLKMGLEAMSGEENATVHKLKEGIKSAEEKAAQIMKDLRSTTYGLKPVGLDISGLIRSLNSLFEEVRLSSGPTIRFFTHDVPEHFDSTKAIALFRIAQEAILNVIKHAHASEVHVNLVGKVGFLSLSVEDDGIGFDVQATPESALGLLLMQERATQFGGLFTIDSSLNRGTHILVEIPL
jgi:PAS domain S-box-containing protein